MDLGDLFKSLVWDALVRVALQQLFKAIPWLGWGPVGWIVTWIVTHFADMAYEELKLYVDMKAIVLRNEQHKRAYTEAALNLQRIAMEKGIDSPEFKEAREDEKQKLSEFIRFRAAA